MGITSPFLVLGIISMIDNQFGWPTLFIYILYWYISKYTCLDGDLFLDENRLEDPWIRLLHIWCPKYYVIGIPDAQLNLHQSSHRHCWYQFSILYLLVRLASFHPPTIVVQGSQIHQLSNHVNMDQVYPEEAWQHF